MKVLLGLRQDACVQELLIYVWLNKAATPLGQTMGSLRRNPGLSRRGYPDLNWAELRPWEL
jgi:hypothetical protein